jgi:hypothetical protein
VPNDSTTIAEDIGIAALKLAKEAHAAGLATLAYLLESAALEAGAQAVGRPSPADAGER